MIFCQIWIGGKIPENRLECVRSFVSLAGETDRFLLVTDETENARHYPDAEILHPSLLYMEALAMTYHPDWWIRYTGRGPKQFLADFLRLHLGSLYPDMLYADTDVLFSGLPEFMPGKPYLGQWGRYSEPFLFFTNGRPEWFSLMMRRIEKTPADKINLPFLWADRAVQAETGTIGEEYFRHMRLGEYTK